MDSKLIMWDWIMIQSRISCATESILMSIKVQKRLVENFLHPLEMIFSM